MGFLLSAEALVEVGGDAGGHEGVGVPGGGHRLVLADLGGGAFLLGPVVDQVSPVHQTSHENRGGGQEIPEALVGPESLEGGEVQTTNSGSTLPSQTL